MNYKMMGRFVAQILAIEALFMIPALLVSLYYRENSAVVGFLYTLALVTLLAGALFFLCRGRPTPFTPRKAWSAWALAGLC